MMENKSLTDISRALVVFKPVESKRLIAKAVSEIPAVKAALQNGYIIIAGGTTNAYISRLLTGSDIDIYRYTAGWIHDGKLATTPKETRLKPIILHRGKQSEKSLKEAIEDFTANDVFIKGANAVDPQGMAGILAASGFGGTIGTVWGTVLARGAHFICPVGLEKLIPSVPAAAKVSGQLKFQYIMGTPSGLLAIAGAEIITEIEAFRVLYGLEAVHIASGGVDGSEGSVVLSVSGAKTSLQKMWEDIKNIKDNTDY